MPERLNGPVLKTGGRKSRGFESHPLRQPPAVANIAPILGRPVVDLAVLLSAMVIAVVLVGCSSVGVRTFGYAFPPEGGRPGLPVLLTDHAGAVAQLDEAPPGLQPVAAEGFMTEPQRPLDLPYPLGQKNADHSILSR